MCSVYAHRLHPLHTADKCNLLLKLSFSSAVCKGSNQIAMLLGSRAQLGPVGMVTMLASVRGNMAQHRSSDTKECAMRQWMRNSLSFIFYLRFWIVALIVSAAPGYEWLLPDDQILIACAGSSMLKSHVEIEFEKWDLGLTTLQSFTTWNQIFPNPDRTETHSGLQCEQRLLCVF